MLDFDYRGCDHSEPKVFYQLLSHLGFYNNGYLRLSWWAFTKSHRGLYWKSQDKLLKELSDNKKKYNSYKSAALVTKTTWSDGFASYLLALVPKAKPEPTPRLIEKSVHYRD